MFLSSSQSWLFSFQIWLFCLWFFTSSWISCWLMILRILSIWIPRSVSLRNSFVLFARCFEISCFLDVLSPLLSSCLWIAIAGVIVCINVLAFLRTLCLRLSIVLLQCLFSVFGLGFVKMLELHQLARCQQKFEYFCN